MRIIKVPDNKLPVSYEGNEGEAHITKQESYFWFIIKVIVRQQLSKMTALEISEFRPFNKEILAHDGKAILKITREPEYKKLREWVENFKGWPGKVETLADDVDAVLEAFREAEKTKEPEAVKK